MSSTFRDKSEQGPQDLAQLLVDPFEQLEKEFQDHLLNENLFHPQDDIEENLDFIVPPSKFSDEATNLSRKASSEEESNFDSQYGGSSGRSDDPDVGSTTSTSDSYSSSSSEGEENFGVYEVMSAEREYLLVQKNRIM